MFLHTAEMKKKLLLAAPECLSWIPFLTQSKEKLLILGLICFCSCSYLLGLEWSCLFTAINKSQDSTYISNSANHRRKQGERL